MSGKVLITLTASNAWYSKQLRRAIQSDVNHSLVLYESSDWGDWRAVDTQEKGVVPSVDAKKLTRVDYAECWECKTDLWAGLRATKKHLYKKYDWLGLFFGLIRVLLANYMYIRLEKPIHAHNRMFCSEYVAAVLKGAKVPGTEEWVCADISPADLKNFMKDSDEFSVAAVPSPVAKLTE